jgi:hypothetical protein
MRAKVRFNQAQKNTVQYYTISEENGEARIGDIAPLDMPNKKRRVVVSSYRLLQTPQKVPKISDGFSASSAARAL